MSFALIIGLSTFGAAIYGVFNYSVSANTDVATSVANPPVTQLSSNVPKQPVSIDYSRPSDTENFAENSGGPFVSGESDSENLEIDKDLKTIQTTSNQASLPMVWAHMGKINNEFGFRRNPFGGRNYEFHAGIDIDGERGDIVVAPAGGIVTEAGWKGGYGQMIEVDHGNGLKTRYGHLSKIGVTAGESITRGHPMGLVGSTGRSTGPHLHYELRLNDKPINPRKFLPPEVTELKKTVR